MKQGEIVTWDIRAFVARDRLQAALDGVNLKVDIPVAEKKTFLKRAIKQCLDAQIIRLIGETEDRVAYAVVDEETDFETAEWNGRQREGIILHKKSGMVTFNSNSSTTRDIQEAYNSQSGGLVGQDIGIVVRRVLLDSCDAISIRPLGGVYFVPSAHLKKVDLLEEAMRVVSSARNKIRLHRLGVITEARTTSDIAALLSDAIATEAEEIFGEVKEAIKDTASRPCLFENRKKRTVELLKKLGRYQSALKTVDLEGAKAKLLKAQSLVVRTFSICTARKTLTQRLRTKKLAERRREKIRMEREQAHG
jgi:hypothetical protein